MTAQDSLPLGRDVAGVDEVGRGCLFGPVFAAAVMLEGSAVLTTATGFGSAGSLVGDGFGSVIVRLVTASKGVISTIRGADSSGADEVTTTGVSAAGVAVG